ncbi:GntR family transcriptional regulator [Kribbella steppae]|uniref:GntR family transcriptional regulator n=1 Tax=Kribbella steppae TaxID=2512223 RepID=A0A4V2RYW9_9ACTN|nr:GntR family transcriptional regulator [Kribbella steppae]
MSGIPAYRQVATDLRDKINSGDYAPGAKLPSERVLTEDYGVSRITIREAIGLLRSEGLVEPKQGKGLFVRNPPSVRRQSSTRLGRKARQENRAAFQGDAEASGFRPEVETTVRTEPASDDHGEALGVPPGTELLVRERIMKADGVTVQLSTSRLPRELTRGTAIEDENPGPGGIHQRLEDAGVRLDRFTEAVITRMPNTTAGLRDPHGVRACRRW